MSLASQSDRGLGARSLPAFVERAQEDARCREALARLGYRKVKAAYARQLRDARDAETFYGLEFDLLWPSMDFVRDWLKAEKRRLRARARGPFLAALLPVAFDLLMPGALGGQALLHLGQRHPGRQALLLLLLAPLPQRPDLRRRRPQAKTPRTLATQSQGSRPAPTASGVGRRRRCAGETFRLTTRSNRTRI